LNSPHTSTSEREDESKLKAKIEKENIAKEKKNEMK